MSTRRKANHYHYAALNKGTATLMLSHSTLKGWIKPFLCLFQVVSLLLALVSPHAAAMTPMRSTSHMMMHNMPMAASMQDCCSAHMAQPTSPQTDAPSSSGHCSSCMHTACDTSAAVLPLTNRTTDLFSAHHRTGTPHHTVLAGKIARPDLPPPRTQTV